MMSQNFKLPPKTKRKQLTLRSRVHSINVDQKTQTALDALGYPRATYVERPRWTAECFTVLDGHFESFTIPVPRGTKPGTDLIVTIREA